MPATRLITAPTLSPSRIAPPIVAGVTVLHLLHTLLTVQGPAQAMSFQGSEPSHRLDHCWQARFALPPILSLLPMPLHAASTPQGFAHETGQCSPTNDSDDARAHRHPTFACATVCACSRLSRLLPPRPAAPSARDLCRSTRHSPCTAELPLPLYDIPLLA